jgi:type VI secretion system secreted protein VgrG
MYSGSPTFNTSIATPLTQTVNAAALVATNTQLSSSALTATVGQTINLTAAVTSSSTATPTGTVTFKDGSNVLGTVALGGNGQAVLAVSTLSQGTHMISAVYSGSSTFATSPSNVIAEVLTQPAVAPTETNTKRFGFHQQPTSLVLTFSAALNPTRAQTVSDYQIMTLGGPGRGGSNVGHVIAVSSAVYNPTADTVTLDLSERLDVHNQYQLTVEGTAPNGLTGATGLLLDGANNGKPGSNFVTVISRSTLAGPAPALLQVRRRAVRISAGTVDTLAAMGELTSRTVKAPVHHGS